MIQREMESGVPLDRIMIGEFHVQKYAIEIPTIYCHALYGYAGGFSMGGEMAMHMGYRFFNDIGGVFAFSSCLNQESVVYRVTD